MSSGRIVTRNEAEVQFVLGSGRQGLAYLIDRDGFLFESPITWYSQKRQWDLSPGFEVANYHFDRPIRPGCLYCHANRVESVPGTDQPVSAADLPRATRSVASAVTGRASSMRSARSIEGGRDRRSSTPPHLEPSLRDAVCEQCHLIGDHRVVRAGRQRGGLSARLAVRSVLDGVRTAQRAGGKPLRRPGRADARESLLQRQPGTARVHLLPRSPHLPPVRGEGGLLPGSLPGVPRRSRLQPPGGGPARAESRR